MTPSFWEVPLQVIAALEMLGVRHHVDGSFASSIHGVPRQTRDLDLVAELTPGHVAPFAALLQADFYLDEVSMLRAIERRSHFNLVHHATGFKVDLFVAGAGAFDRSEMGRAAPYPLGEDPPRSVPIKSAEDILLRKLAWYRWAARSPTANGPMSLASPERRQGASTFPISAPGPPSWMSRISSIAR